MMKRSLALLIAVILTSSIMACQPNIGLDDDEVYNFLQEGFEKSSEWDNYSINTLTYVSTEALEDEKAGGAGGYTEYSTTGDIIISPLKARIVVSMKLDNMNSPMVITQYLEKTGNTVDVYQEVSSAWLKYVLEGENLNDLIGVDPMANLALIMNYMKKASYEGEENALNRPTYKIKVEVEGKVFFEQVKKSQEMGLSSYIKELEKLGVELETLGDLTYYIYIDQETMEIDKYETDMSNVLHALADKMLELEIIDENQGKQYQTAKMVLKTELYNQNGVKDFVIDQSIKDAATEITTIDAL